MMNIIDSLNKDDIRGRRVNLEMTQKQLAEILGVSVDAVKSWELGRNPVTKICSIAIHAVLSEAEAEQRAKTKQAERQEHIQKLASKPHVPKITVIDSADL